MPNEPATIRTANPFTSAADRQETLALEASVPLRLDVPQAIWLVRSGKIDLFGVTLEQGELTGTRYPLCQIAEGEGMFGIPAGDDRTIIAVGHLDTVVELLSGRDFDALPVSSRVTLVDRWVMLLAGAALGAAPAWPERVAAPGDKLELKPGQSLYAQRDVAWVRIRHGSLTATGEEADAGALVLVAAGLAVCAATPAEIELIATAEALDDGIGILGPFHSLILSALGRLIAAAARASDLRLSARDEANHRSLRAALTLLADTGFGVEPEQDPVFASDPTVAAFAAVAEHHGILLSRIPHTLSFTETAVRSIARANGVGLRQVLLRGAWWRSDSGAMLAWRGEERRPIALLPTGVRSYRAWDPADGSSVPIEGGVAAEIAPAATTTYRPLPQIVRGVVPLLAFSMRGVASELATIASVSVLAAVMAALFPLTMGFLLESAVPRAEIGEVVVAILGLTIAAIGAGGFNLVQSIGLLRLEGRLETAMQPALMHRLLALPASFFRTFASGELTNRVLSIQNMRRILAGTSLQSMLAAVFAAANFAVILFISPVLGLVSSALVGVAAAISGALAIGELRQDRVRVDLRGQEDGLVVQLVQAIAKIRVAAAETRIFAVWARIFARQKHYFRTGQRFALAGEVFAEIFPLIATVALFFVAARLLTPGENAPAQLGLGGFLAISAAFGQLLAATMMMSRTLAATLELVPLFERLRPIAAAVPESAAEKREAGPLSGGVEVNRVVFRYAEGSRPVLDDLSLRIEPGSFVAFVGPSGSGKSTLLRLLLGFETPESGDILYDSQSISTLDAGSLRRQIGVVLQHGRVATGSIFENITGGLPYTLSEAWEAARLAGIDQDIEAMPMGMHTVLIEGSSTLSGGQRQRLMIARALIGRPRLLLFDEATSALDNRSQALVTQSLNGLRTTRIVIAHRLTTVQRADRIFVLDGGRLVETGNFNVLIAQNGLFARLAHRQII